MAFCREKNKESGKRYTYGISVIGELSFNKGMAEHVKNISAMLCANTLPVTIEVLKYKSKYRINYNTHLEDDRYVHKYNEMFDSAGISCTCEQLPNFIEAYVAY